MRPNFEEFKNRMYRTVNTDAEELKAYIAAGSVHLVDADNPSHGLCWVSAAE